MEQISDLTIDHLRNISKQIKEERLKHISAGVIDVFPIDENSVLGKMGMKTLVVYPFEPDDKADA